jgi:hypothetical protein
MKHALLAALMLLAGCAAEQERTEAGRIAYGAAAQAETPTAQPRETPPAGTSSISTSSLPAVDPKVALERALRNDRLIYAKGLEKILLTHGVAASVRVHEWGKAGPTPALMFFGHFSPSFVQRALTEGAVLERARTLGFRSVEFVDRGQDGNFLFELRKTGPLPKCAAYDRLCL